MNNISTINGTITNVIFNSQAYIVAIVENAKESYTVCGIMPNARKGDKVELSGDWKKHHIHGDRFAFNTYTMPVAQTEEDIRGFLEALKGIGAATAKKIVEAFGTDTFEVIENTSVQLLEIPGITEKKRGTILASYYEKCGMQKLISFFHSIDVSATHASKIHEKYGAGAVVTIKNNPYILGKEIRGMGFASADKIALALGILPNSPFRIQAGLVHILKEAAYVYGHCFLPKDELCYAAQQLLNLPTYKINAESVTKLIDHFSQEHITDLKRFVQDGGVYSATIYNAEVGVAKKIVNLGGSYKVSADIELWMSEYQLTNGISFSNGQREVIKTAAFNGVSVVTGGAGVGKSTVLKAVIELWDSCSLKIIALAPTGKAAQRIREISGFQSASTIHKFLHSLSRVKNFSDDEKELIEADAFLIDEFSMVDVELAWALFQAISPHARVIIIGDVNQLPAIGPGNVLKNIIASNVVPVVELTTVFRQAEHSKITKASQAIVRGYFHILDIF